MNNFAIFGNGSLLYEPAEVLLVLPAPPGVAAVDGPLRPVDLTLADITLVLLILQGEGDDQSLFEVAPIHKALLVEGHVIVPGRVELSEVIELPATAALAGAAHRPAFR